MVRIVVRDMSERIFLENEFSENMTIYDLKKQLVMVLRKESQQASTPSDVEPAKDTLCFRMFYNKKVITENIPVSAFGYSKEICLHFEMGELISSQKASCGEDAEAEHRMILEPEDPAIRKSKILVSKKNILVRNGRAYLVIYRRRRSNFSRELNRFLSSSRRDLFLKLSVILLLIALKNIEVAFILAVILLMRFFGSMKLRTNKNFEGKSHAVFKTVFLFFYTMLVIFADDNIPAV